MHPSAQELNINGTSCIGLLFGLTSAILACAEGVLCLPISPERSAPVVTGTGARPWPPAPPTTRMISPRSTQIFFHHHTSRPGGGVWAGAPTNQRPDVNKPRGMKRCGGKRQSVALVSSVLAAGPTLSGEGSLQKGRQRPLKKGWESERWPTGQALLRPLRPLAIRPFPRRSEDGPHASPSLLQPELWEVRGSIASCGCYNSRC